MKTKKLLACLMASLMACGAFTACGDKEEDKSSSKESSSVSESSADSSSESSADSASESESSTADSSSEPVVVETVEFEDPVGAEPGDAYLAMVDSQVWVQYWGKADDGSVLAYDAGVADITGDGDYTVSVTADTNGFRYDTTGDANGEYTPSGVSFMAVMIPDGESLYPGAVITVNAVRIDGQEIEMVSKAYTSSDDGKETRANIFNTYIKDNPPSPDARTAEGELYVGGDENSPTDACANYSPAIINPDDFADGWTTVEVDFTITGTGL